MPDILDSLNGAPPVADAPPAELGLGEDTGVSAPLSFTPDQVATLLGGPAEPGQEYTVTIRAGDVGEDGSVSFDVVSAPGGEGGLPPTEGDLPTEEEIPPPGGEVPEGDELGEGALPPLGGASASPFEPDSPETTKALGYDRNALRKKTSERKLPKLSAKDLEYD
jgi:hypothetical protein